MCNQFFRPSATGRIEFSARLLLNSSSGYSKNRVSFFHSVSAYWQALLSAVAGGGHKTGPEFDRLSNILKAFNDHFGTLFTDLDRVAQRIRDDTAPKVAADQAYQNAKKNTPNAARIEHDEALAKVMLTLLKDDTQVYKQFVENESFRRFVTDMVFALTSDAPTAP